MKEEAVLTTVATEDFRSSQEQPLVVEEPQYPTGFRLLSILVPLGICTFLIALVANSHSTAMNGD